MQPANDKAGPSKGIVTQPLVLVVDDDAALREALCDLLLSAGHEPAPFSTTAELLASDLLDRPGCLVLDVRMPGASGLDLQRQLDAAGIAKPIIFLTGHGDIPMTVQAMKAGAVDFLTKPVRDQTLLDAVARAIAADVRQHDAKDASRIGRGSHTRMGDHSRLGSGPHRRHGNANRGPGSELVGRPAHFAALLPGGHHRLRKTTRQGAAISALLAACPEPETDAAIRLFLPVMSLCAPLSRQLRIRLKWRRR